MIFKWENYFTEKQLEDAFDLDIKVESVMRSINYISADVIENGETYQVSIDINDKFQIESCECECGKLKCRHMTAVIYALDYDNKYIEYDMTVEHPDKSWMIIVDLIEKIAQHEEDLVFDFLYECLSHNYSALYPPFRVLMNFFTENFSDEKYLKQKTKLLGV